MDTQHAEVIIIGAGVAGLSCARELAKAGVNFVILEADKSIGGRLQTDEEDGFLFDRGFQVLQLAYPAAKKMLDYDKLDIRKFPPGVRIWAEGSFHIMADPLRKPTFFFSTAFSKIGSFADRLKLARLAHELSKIPLEKIFEMEEMFVEEYLSSRGFTNEMITRFFRPFMTGVCLDPQIRITHRFLLFILRMFAQDDVGVPARGMGEIPRQLAAGIPETSIICNTPVHSLEKKTVTLKDGGQMKGEAVVLATSGPETARLLGKPYNLQSSRELCLYYSATEPPVKHPFLTLNGEKNGLINSVNFHSMISQDYAPRGTHLISAVLPGHPDQPDSELEDQARRELCQWFGNQVDAWQFLRPYKINPALPQPVPPSPNPFRVSSVVGESIFDCSEYHSMPSIQWALHAGERTAKEVRAALQESSRQ